MRVAVEGLRVRFGPVLALDGVDLALLDVALGEKWMPQKHQKQQHEAGEAHHCIVGQASRLPRVMTRHRTYPKAGKRDACPTKTGSLPVLDVLGGGAGGTLTVLLLFEQDARDRLFEVGAGVFLR